MSEYVSQAHTADFWISLRPLALSPQRGPYYLFLRIGSLPHSLNRVMQLSPRPVQTPGSAPSLTSKSPPPIRVTSWWHSVL